MQAPFPPRDDAGIPLLTEVLDLPPPARRAETAPPAPPWAAPAAPAAPAVPVAPRPAEEADIEALRTAILQDLLDRVEPLLKTRMRASLEVAAARALEDIAYNLREELGRLVDEAVQKELIRRAAIESKPLPPR
ncbi:hypothetical protein [Pigmentiphaga sp.]|uniref:hypothetical protein n=1 Tax=Pigmentiphaga sp. TaxID=1977564 RepID=UPI0025FC4A55|nr:hypothetical protein [Pigmentiphaga sp.]